MATPQTSTAASSASNTSMMSMVGTTAAGSVGSNVLSSTSVGIPATTTSAASTGVLGTTGSNMSGGFTFSSVMTGGQATIPLPVVMGSQSSMASVSATAIPSFTTLPGTGMAHSYGYGFPTGMYGSGAIGTHISRPVGGGGGGIKDISNKPPVMKSSFDLYAVQLKTYLTRLGLWSLIDGTEIRPLYDINLQADFDARDNAAREAILRGVPEIDAELICHEVSAKDMWVRFENKQTKREYANYIFAREQLYSSKYNRDLEMTDWLRDIQLKRRELSHYGKVISDEEFAEILLANVTRTHRDVVRQFSRHYAALANLELN